MEFRFDLSINYIRGTHLIGSDFPRWRPKSKMTTRKEGNAIYMATKNRNEQRDVNSCVFGVTETYACYGMLLMSPIFKMAAIFLYIYLTENRK